MHMFMLCSGADREARRARVRIHEISAHEVAEVDLRGVRLMPRAQTARKEAAGRRLEF